MSDQTVPSGQPVTVQLGPLSGPARSSEARLKLAVEGFEILGMIDHGGMGVVYRARQKGLLDRDVALKMILAGEGASDAEHARFKAEAMAVGRLHHPNIVEVYQAGVADGHPYIAMEYVDGPSLSKHWDATPQPPRAAAEMVRTVALAIDHAHERNIIHRDLKPGNVLLANVRQTEQRRSSDETLTYADEPTPKVADFGLAKQLDENFELSRSGQPIGTPSYMSPEQAFGRKDVGPAADVYSLGAMLYYGLTGRPPFRGENELDTLDQVRFREPVPVRQLAPKVPADLETICLKCLQKEPKKRYGSARALADDLGRFLEGRPVLARPVGRAERVWRWCKRNPGLATLASCLGVVVTAAALGGWWLAARATRNEREALRQKEISDQRAYDFEMNRAFEDYREGNPKLVAERLRRHVPETVAPDRRGFEWYYAERLLHLYLRSFEGHKGLVSALAFSPDGRWLATGGADETIRVWDMARGQLGFVLRGHSGRVAGLAFSPDGRYLASAGWDRDVILWDVSVRRMARALHGHRNAVTSVAFSPDGKRLATASGDCTIRLWPLDGSTDPVILRGNFASVRSIAFSPDGRRLASGGADREVRVWDLETGRPVRVLKGHAEPVWGVCFSPDGRRLASASEDGTARLWDLDVPGRTLELARPGGDVLAIVFSLDGASVATAGQDGTVQVWDAQTGKEMFALRGHEGSVNCVAYSPDGWRLASGGSDGIVRVWAAHRPLDFLLLQGHTEDIRTLAFSNDNQRLASGSSDGTLRLWNVADGDCQRTLSGHTGPVTAASWSADDRLLASGGEDGSLRIWEAATGRLKHIIRVEGSVRALSFDPLGPRLATGSDNGVIVLWDVTTGDSIRELARGQAPVTSLAFSQDGRRLAAGWQDGRVAVHDTDAARQTQLETGGSGAVAWVGFASPQRVVSARVDGAIHAWDLSGEAPVLTCNLQTNVVISAALAPPARVASGATDGAVHVWDLQVGQELVTLTRPGAARKPTYVALSRDGRVLAASDGRKIRLYNSRPIPLGELEARCIVEAFFDRGLEPEAVVRQLEADASIGGTTRGNAMSLARTLGPELIHCKAAEFVQALFNRPLLRSEVVNSIAEDPSLGDAVRKEALALAREHSEQIGALNEASWSVVRQPGASPDDYQKALRQAEAAYRVAPSHGIIRTTLGLANYRVGQYAEAVRVLKEIRPEADDLRHPFRLAALAMASFRLGEIGTSEASLRDLRAVMKEPQWAKNPAAVALSEEAEQTVTGIGRPGTSR